MIDNMYHMYHVIDVAYLFAAQKRKNEDEKIDRYNILKYELV